MSDDLKELKKQIQSLESANKRLAADLAREQKECIAALRDRDYNGSKWRYFEIECNRLNANIEHNALTGLSH